MLEMCKGTNGSNLWTKVAHLDFINKLNRPHISQPIQSIAMEIERANGSGEATIKSASWSAGHIGLHILNSSERGFSTSNLKTNVSTRANILTIRNKATFNSKQNKISIKLSFVTFASDGNKIAIFNFWRNATLGGTPEYIDIDSNNSIVDYDISGTTVTNGINEGNFTLGKIDSKAIPLEELEIILFPGDIFTISGESSTASELAAALKMERIILKYDLIISLSKINITKKLGINNEKYI